MRRSVRATGPAAPETAWERYAETSAWSGWSPQVRHVSPHGRIHPGMRGRVNLLVPFRVLAVDEVARTWAWEVRLGPVPLRLRHSVVAADDGSLTTLDLDGPAPLVLPYLPLALLALRRLVS